MLRFLRIEGWWTLFVLPVLLLSSGVAEGRVETFRWRAPSATSVDSLRYRIHYGDRPGVYSEAVDVAGSLAVDGDTQAYDLEIPHDQGIYVAMTAHRDGIDSDFSNEIFRGGVVVPTLTNVTSVAGLLDSSAPPSPPPFDALSAYMSGAAAAGDYDSDGWIDLFVTRWGQPDRLFRNRGDGTFVERTLEAGLGESLPSNGAAWVDIDNDDDLDLYVTTTGPGAQRFYLYVNDGAGHFDEQAIARGVAVEGEGERYGQSIAVGDFDGDGWLDLHTTAWWPGVAGGTAPASSARLLRNRGLSAPGYFEDVTEAAGVELGGASGVASFSSRFSDIDQDGWLDLLVVGDGGTSRLFWNRGDGSFLDGTDAAGVGTDENGTGGAVADFDGDGKLDWFITGIHHPEDPCATLACGFAGSGNRLYLGAGNRRFVDATDAVGVREGFWGTGAALYDLDNDGDLDVVMNNGVVAPPPSDPASEAYQHFEADPVRVWVQQEGGGVQERSAELGVIDHRTGRGVLVFDYDADGDLDLLLVGQGGVPALYRNDLAPGNSWLRVSARGVDSNAFGVGVVVRLWERAGSTALIRELDGGSHYLGQSETVAHFGLGGDAGTVDRVEVYWPSTGRKSVLRDVARNQEILVLEPGGAEGGDTPEDPLPGDVETGTSGGTACGLLGVEVLLVGLVPRVRRRRSRPRD
jgi:hypothetical protein